MALDAVPANALPALKFELSTSLNELKANMQDSQAIKDIQRELDIYQLHDGLQFGYHFFVLKRNAL